MPRIKEMTEVNNWRKNYSFFFFFSSEWQHWGTTTISANKNTDLKISLIHWVMIDILFLFDQFLNAFLWNWNMDEQESRMFPDNLMFKTVFAFCFLQLSYPLSTRYVNKFYFNFCLHWSGGRKRAGGGGEGGGGRESPVARPGMVRGNLHRGVRVFKVKLPALLKAFQSLLTSPEFVQNFKGLQFFDHGLSIGSRDISLLHPNKI